MKTVRVVYRPDGKVTILRPGKRSRRLKAPVVLESKETVLVDTDITTAMRYFGIKDVNLFLSNPPEEIVWEPETEWLERVFSRMMDPQYDKDGNQVNLSYSPEGLPYDDVDDSSLPSREDRVFWEGEKGKSITINTVKAAESAINKENRSKIDMRKNEILEQQAITELKASGDLPANYA